MNPVSKEWMSLTIASRHRAVLGALLICLLAFSQLVLSTHAFDHQIDQHHGASCALSVDTQKHARLSSMAAKAVLAVAVAEFTIIDPSFGQVRSQLLLSFSPRSPPLFS